MAYLRDTAGVILRDTAGAPLYDTRGNEDGLVLLDDGALSVTGTDLTSAGSVPLENKAITISGMIWFPYLPGRCS